MRPRGEELKAVGGGTGPAVPGARLTLVTSGALVMSTTVGLVGGTSTWRAGRSRAAAVAGVVAVLAGGLLVRDSLPLAHAAAVSTTRPSGVRTSTEAISWRLAAVPAVSRIVLPFTDRQLPTRSVRPSRVRTTRV